LLSSKLVGRKWVNLFGGLGHKTHGGHRSPRRHKISNPKNPDTKKKKKKKTKQKKKKKKKENRGPPFAKRKKRSVAKGEDHDRARGRRLK